MVVKQPGPRAESRGRDLRLSHQPRISVRVGRCVVERVLADEAVAVPLPYVPSKMAHEAWTTAKEGALLFMTVDGAWDINWVNGPPKPQDLLAAIPPR